MAEDGKVNWSIDLEATVPAPKNEWAFMMRKTEPEKKKGKWAKYEENRGDRGVMLKWKRDRPWLEMTTDDHVTVMSCTWCQEVHTDADPESFTWQTNKTSFINCATVPRGDAVNIVLAMKRSISLIGIPWSVFTEKLVGMGSDGANVMLGAKGGVAALLRQEQPALLAVHCYAHKLELAFKDSIKTNSLHDKVAVCLLQGLYYLYHNSPLNRSNLKASFKSLGLKPVVPTRVGGTRWVGHLLRALVNFMTGYPAIKQHLEQVVNPTERITASTSGKGKGILKLIKSKDIILFAHFLADVLTVLARLSNQFQERACSAADIHGSLQECVRLLSRQLTKDGPHLVAAKGLLELTDELTLSQRKGDHFEAARKSLIEGLLKSIEKRFEVDSVIEAMKLISFKAWPLAEDLDEIEDFGDVWLQCILQRYKTVLQAAGIDTAQAVLEWTCLKSDIYATQPNKVQQLTVERVAKRYSQGKYSNILPIFDLILTVPVSSSECERGFRHMKAVKTDVRSRLGEEGLSDQLMIRMRVPNIETFDPLPAIHLWNKLDSRRPNFHQKKAVKRRMEREVEEENDDEMEEKEEKTKEDIVISDEEEGDGDDELDVERVMEENGLL